MSALDFLDIDASWYLNEYYLTSCRSKEWKGLLNDQYKYHLKDFKKYYGEDILKNRVATGYRPDGSNYLKKHNFNRYLLDVHKNGLKRGKRRYNQTPGHLRAIEYRKEMRFIRRQFL